MSLKVEFVRYKNVLCAAILEQGDEISRGTGVIFTHGGYTLISDNCPDLSKDTLFIRGRKKRNGY